MTKSLTKVIYKPSTQSSEEFTVIVNLEEVRVFVGNSIFSLSC